MTTTRISVAEDERDIRDLIVFLLTMSGYQVTDVPNGKKPYETAQEIIPDLILIDVRMSQMTGYEACLALKELDPSKDIPVVFLSAKGQEAEMQYGLSIGAGAYFLKPFTPDELIENSKNILLKYNKY